MKNNQKTLILIALAVVLVGVGAFTILPSLTGPASTPVVATKATPKPAPTADGTKTADPKALDPKAGDPAKSPLPAASTGKDPMAPETAADGKTPVDPTKPVAGKGAVQPKPDESSKLRDPFAKPSNVSGVSSDVTTQTPAPTTPKPAPTEGTPSTPAAPRASQRQPWLQPLSPNSGSLPMAGSTPLPMGAGTGSRNGAPALRSGPRYKLKGVLQGAVSVAVLEDADGNERMVRIGEQCDADTKVTGISRGRITVQEKGKDKVIVIEEQTG